jgi:hypothetical protein
VITPAAAARPTLLTRLRPYTDQVGALRALGVTVWALLRGARREVWIGDSHAAALLVGPTWANFLTGPRGEIVLRAGARLMYSLAHRGFPPRVTRFVKVSRWGRRDSFVPVFVAGEIDVRNALAARPDSDYAFVDAYVGTVAGLAQQMRASRAHVVVPPPPRPADELVAGYPHVGSDTERLRAFARLREELAAAAARRAGVVLIGLTDAVAGPDRVVRPEVSDAGCPTHPVGHPVIRQAIAAHPDFRSGQR